MNLNPAIKVVQYMYGNAEYFPWSEKVNRTYCARHGYRYALSSSEPRGGRHVCWHKVPTILGQLDDCDYLLFLDADAVFYSQELKIETEIVPLLKNKAILMVQDVGRESERWHPGMPNSGVVLVKNVDPARDILTAWDAASDLDPEVRWTWPPDQLGFWRHVMPRFENSLEVILDYYLLQGRYGQYIRHFYQTADRERVERIREIDRRISRQTTADASLSFGAPVVKVLQYMYGEHNSAYAITREINAAYCRRHGYEYIVVTTPPREDRSCHWAKIPAMREHLVDCDYLFFLDADAFFYSHELKIEDELLPFLGDKEIMMAADYACETRRHQPDKPNAGTIFVRNTEKAAEMLRCWDESSERPDFQNWRFNWFHEQDACFMGVWREYADGCRLLKDYYLMNGYYGVFIRHLMAMPDERRVEILRHYLKTHRPKCIRGLVIA